MKRKSVFVVENDKLMVSLIQKEISLNDELYLIGTSTNGKDALMQIKSIRNIDIIITELVLPLMDGFNLINEINSLYEEEKRPQIIVTTGLVNQSILNLISSLNISNFLLKPYEVNNLIHMLKHVPIITHPEIVKKEDNQLERVVSDILKQLGIPAHIKGYSFLRTAIMWAYENKDYQGRVTKILYPDIAKKYKTTSSRVERAIRHAIEVAWNRGNIDFFDEVFSYTVSEDKGKPTNSEFIAITADYIRLRHNQNVMTY